MIDQDLINKLQFQINESKDGFAPAYFNNDEVQSLLNNYIALIEQNAELHKELAKSKEVMANACCLCGLCHLGR